MRSDALSGRNAGLAAGLALLAGALAPAAAGAAIPSGNLLVNGDAETGSHALNSSDAFVPQGWFPGDGTTPGYPHDTNATAVGYAAPGFFTAAERAKIAGGQAFFAGGPGGTQGQTGTTSLFHDVDASAAAAEIDAGQVQLTVGGCLGGYADQKDFAVLNAFTFLQNQGQIQIAQAGGPGPAERGNLTTLLPKATTVAVPAGARAIRIGLYSYKDEPAGSYNDGYADNLFVALQPVGATPPAPVCTPTTPGGGSGGAGGGSGGSGGGTSETGGIEPVGRARFKGKSVRITLRCERHEGECAGRITLSVGKLPKAAGSAVRLGGKQFSIPAGQTQVVKVRIGRKARVRFGSTPKRGLRKVRLRLRVVTDSGTAGFKLRLRR